MFSSLERIIWGSGVKVKSQRTNRNKQEKAEEKRERSLPGGRK